MKEKTMTYAAPGQGTFSKCAEWLEKRNELATALFEGEMNNEFVLRCCLTAMLALAAIVMERMEGFNGWTFSMWLLAAICFRPAVQMFNQKVEE